MSTPITELAKNYVDLSNQGPDKLEEVFKLFHKDCLYLSNQLGGYEGIEYIREMMTQFFTNYKKIQWSVGAYNKVSKYVVTFNFMMVARDVESGKRIRRAGQETMTFDDDGLIVKVEVKVEVKVQG
jgi:hypothetical protein